VGGWGGVGGGGGGGGGCGGGGGGGGGVGGGGGGTRVNRGGRHKWSGKELGFRKKRIAFKEGYLVGGVEQPKRKI